MARLHSNLNLPGAILADDLTGAADAGLPFALRGSAARIWLEHGQKRHGGSLDSAGVDVYDTASRCDPPELAAAKVQRLCRSLMAEGRAPIFKKIDSTLLGNLAIEIEAALEACGFEAALVAPAFPAMGRTLSGGLLHLFGRPSDPPLFLPALLHRRDAAVQVNLDVLNQGSEAVAETLTRLIGQGARLIALDSATQGDLRCIVQAAEIVEPRTLLAGSGALAGELAALIPSAGSRQEDAPEPEKTGRVLLIIGSANPATERQLSFLLDSRRVVSIESGSSFDRGSLGDGIHLLLRVKPGIEPEVWINELLEGEVRGLVLSGGDTAEAVARYFDAAGIRLLGEIAPGLPWGRFIGGRADGLAVATKAGGFGAEEALVKAVDFLASDS